MAYFIELPTFGDKRGKLTIVEDILPFKVKRFYYIYDTKAQRGGHRHKKTLQALVCLGGSCEVYVNNGKMKEIYLLDNPQKCLIVDPQDWHTMDNFSDNATLLVFASMHYDVNDYIDESYDENNRV